MRSSCRSKVVAGLSKSLTPIWPVSFVSSSVKAMSLSFSESSPSAQRALPASSRQRLRIRGLRLRLLQYRRAHCAGRVPRASACRSARRPPSASSPAPADRQLTAKPADVGLERADSRRPGVDVVTEVLHLDDAVHRAAGRIAAAHRHVRAQGRYGQQRGALPDGQARSGGDEAAAGIAGQRLQRFQIELALQILEVEAGIARSYRCRVRRRRAFSTMLFAGTAPPLASISKTGFGERHAREALHPRFACAVSVSVPMVWSD